MPLGDLTSELVAALDPTGTRDRQADQRHRGAERGARSPPRRSSSSTRRSSRSRPTRSCASGSSTSAAPTSRLIDEVSADELIAAGYSVRRDRARARDGRVVPRVHRADNATRSPRSRSSTAARTSSGSPSRRSRSSRTRSDARRDHGRPSALWQAYEALDRSQGPRLRRTGPDRPRLARALRASNRRMSSSRSRARHANATTPGCSSRRTQGRSSRPSSSPGSSGSATRRRLARRSPATTSTYPPFAERGGIGKAYELFGDAARLRCWTSSTRRWRHDRTAGGWAWATLGEVCAMTRRAAIRTSRPVRSGHPMRRHSESKPEHRARSETLRLAAKSTDRARRTSCVAGDTCLDRRGPVGANGARAV